jgi:hypothetical protein
MCPYLQYDEIIEKMKIGRNPMLWHKNGLMGTCHHFFKMLPPFELRALDSQLSTVEVHDGAPPGVDAELCAALLRYKDVIEAIRRGIQDRRWSEDAMPYTVKMLDAVPGLLKLSPVAAAALVAAQQKSDGCLFCGQDSINGIKKRVRMSNFRNSLVASIRKKARVFDQEKIAGQCQ